MKFIIKRPEENLVNLMRRLLYSPQAPHQNKYGTGQGKDGKTGEMIFSRFLGPHGYPRFHLYVKESGDELIFNLHLDQKKPSYQGTPAHSGEYEGEIVEKEVERIRTAISYE